jgi:hypothetical protein
VSASSSAQTAYAVGAIAFIRVHEVDEFRASGRETASEKPRCITELFQDRRVLVLVAAMALFHLANAPVMPLVGLYVARLDGADLQVAAVVLTAQFVMIPVALAAGWACNRWGRKWVFAIGFLALPIRVFLYSLTSQPWAQVALQSLDGIGAGIYGVVIVAIRADLTWNSSSNPGPPPGQNPRPKRAHPQRPPVNWFTSWLVRQGARLQEVEELQEVITLIVFAGFSTLYLKETLRWNYLVGFALLVGAAFFVFKKW